ncbi:ABC transporter permease subunit [Nocardia grenadensis]|uniref:ABC transporter permease subunit n=1 Tax=Nocardia grenadensis TaxID=931537 RepID=UPI0007A3FAEA|nr:ABC transporter permease subunit [Nocardia grenadensis]
MLRNVYLKCLRDQRRGLAGWSVGIVALVLLESALWPSISNTAGMREFVKNYPEPLRELFDLDEFGTGTGFLNVELFSMLLPTLFLVFAIGRGARAIAGEEEAGTLEVLLMTRVTPIRLVIEQAAVLATAAAALGTVLFVAVTVFSTVFGLGVAVAAALTGAVAMVLIAVEFGWLALAIGAATGHRVLAIALTSAFAVAAYVLYVASKLVDAVRPWGPLSPFHQAIEGGPLGGGLPAAYGWLLLAGAVALLAGLPVFHRRDIAGV